MKILVINPNTTAAITGAVMSAARAVAAPGTDLVGVTAETGVATIASRTENLIAAQAMLDLAARHAHAYDALILGVSLDTALWPLRELLDIPVIGMTEAGILAATMVSTRAGLLTYGLRMAPVYRELVASYGMEARVTLSRAWTCRRPRRFQTRSARGGRRWLPRKRWSTATGRRR